MFNLVSQWACNVVAKANLALGETLDHSEQATIISTSFRVVPEAQNQWG